MVQINAKCVSGNEFCELRKEQEQKTHLGLKSDGGGPDIQVKIERVYGIFYPLEQRFSK